MRGFLFFQHTLKGLIQRSARSARLEGRVRLLERFVITLNARELPPGPLFGLCLRSSQFQEKGTGWNQVAKVGQPASCPV